VVLQSRLNPNCNRQPPQERLHGICRRGRAPPKRHARRTPWRGRGGGPKGQPARQAAAAAPGSAGNAGRAGGAGGRAGALVGVGVVHGHGEARAGEEQAAVGRGGGGAAHLARLGRPAREHERDLRRVAEAHRVQRAAEGEHAAPLRAHAQTRQARCGRRARRPGKGAPRAAGSSHAAPPLPAWRALKADRRAVNQADRRNPSSRCSCAQPGHSPAADLPSAPERAAPWEAGCRRCGGGAPAPACRRSGRGSRQTAAR